MDDEAGADDLQRPGAAHQPRQPGPPGSVPPCLPLNAATKAIGISRLLKKTSRSMYYGEHGVERRVMREREEASLALRATRPHTVGYSGACDQEEGVVEHPSRQRPGAPHQPRPPGPPGAVVPTG